MMEFVRTKWMAKQAQISTIIKWATSLAEHITNQHLMPLFEHLHNNYVELKELKDMYEVHVSEKILQQTTLTSSSSSTK